MAVARPYGFEIDFLRNPISWSAEYFFIFIIIFTLKLIFGVKIYGKKILGSRKISSSTYSKETLHLGLEYWTTFCGWNTGQLQLFEFVYGFSNEIVYFSNVKCSIAAQQRRQYLSPTAWELWSNRVKSENFNLRSICSKAISMHWSFESSWEYNPIRQSEMSNFLWKLTFAISLGFSSLFSFRMFHIVKFRKNLWVKSCENYLNNPNLLFLIWWKFQRFLSLRLA